MLDPLGLEKLIELLALLLQGTELFEGENQFVALTSPIVTGKEEEGNEGKPSACHVRVQNCIGVRGGGSGVKVEGSEQSK